MGIANEKEAPRSEKLRSISHALDVLNDAAVDSSEEIRRMVQKDYRRIKDSVSDLKPEVRQAFREIRDASVEATKESVKKVDNAAHENPWMFMGGAAAVATVVGFLLGRRISR